MVESMIVSVEYHGIDFEVEFHRPSALIDQCFVDIVMEMAEKLEETVK